MSKTAEWVDNNLRLAELCQQWQSQDCIALDTEFIRSRTFFPKIGLLQIADSQGIYLIDPLAITEIEPLKTLMQNQHVIKIIHSCSEDLEVFDRYLSVLPSPLFDTQIAAAFAGFGSSISYANLIKEIRGDIIPKQETRSDWLQRPLSQSQLNYAALDVEHLIEVYEKLSNSLEKSQRVDWVQGECDMLIAKASESKKFDQYYLKVKSAWKLKPKQLSVLRDLCAWREEQARIVDIPRSHLIKDTSLFELSRSLPQDVNQFYKVRDMHPRFVSQYGEICLDIMQLALDQDESYPQSLKAPLSADQTALYKQLKEKVVLIAETLGIPPEFLARKKDLEYIVQGTNTEEAWPAAFVGWREELLKPSLQLILVDAL